MAVSRFEGIRNALDAAKAALERGDRDAGRSALADAYPLVAEEVAQGPTFFGIVTEQAVVMSLSAGDEALARRYAEVLVDEAGRELERLGTAHRSEVARIASQPPSAEGYAALEQARALLAEAYTIAVTFVPFVQGQTRVSLDAVSPGDDRERAAALEMLLTRVRPVLDRVRWEAWPYSAAAAQRARTWSAYAFVHLGELFLDNASEGRDVEDAQRLAEGALMLGGDGGPDQVVADAWSLLGRALFVYGPRNYDDAIRALQHALEIHSAVGNADDAAADHANLGAFSLERARFAEANAEDQVAADAWRAAEAHLKSAVERYRLDDPYRRLGGVLTNLGVFYSERRRLQDAYEAFLEANELVSERREAFETRASIALNLGAVLNDMRRFADAVLWFRRAVEAIAEAQGLSANQELVVMAHGGLGVALLFTQGAAQAEPSLSHAVEILETYRRTFYSEQAIGALMKRLRWVYEAFIECCARLGERDPARRVLAFETAEAVKWRTLTVLLRFRRLGLTNENEPLLLEERALLDALTPRLLGDPSSVRRDAYVVEAMARLDEIWNTLSTTHPDYVAIRRQQSVRTTEVAQVLDDDVSVLVEYYLGDQYDFALAFVVVRGASVPEIVRLPTTPSQIADLVRELRRSDDQQPANRFRSAALALYRAVLEPVLPFIPEGVGACIVPYGQLHNVPFSALYDGGRYACERNAFVIAATATGLRWWSGKNRRSRERALIFTATSGISDASGRLGDLAWFEDVARKRITPLFREATIVAGAQATRGRLLSELSRSGDDRWDVVHLACHGIAAEHGYESYLVLARSEAGQPNTLPAADIATRVQSSATLVTLSACESAVAESSTSDELAGLCQSFLVAGSSSVLATLWPVRQGAGVKLTRRFYEYWLGKRGGTAPVSKIAALRRAQRDTSRRAGWWIFGDDYSHPYLWSSFQLYGDWR